MTAPTILGPQQITLNRANEHAWPGLWRHSERSEAERRISDANQTFFGRRASLRMTRPELAFPQFSEYLLHRRIRHHDVVRLEFSHAEPGLLNSHLQHAEVIVVEPNERISLGLKILQPQLSPPAANLQLANGQRKRLAEREPRERAQLALGFFIRPNFKLGHLDGSIELALLPRIFDLPVIPQLDLRNFQLAPSREPRLQCWLLGKNRLSARTSEKNRRNTNRGEESHDEPPERRGDASDEKGTV